MRELSLDHLRTLVATADLGSLSAAAAALHLAPPTVTVHIAELEARLGGALLVRGRGPAVPTAMGRVFITRARRLLAGADEAEDEARRHLTGELGAVRLGASTGAIAHLLPQALEHLAHEHPGIDVQALVLTSQDSMARLAAGTLDIAIVALPQASTPMVQVAAWRRDPVLAFLPSGWAAPRRITPRWLADKPLILNDASTRLSRMTGEWFAAAGVHARARMELNYNEAIKSLVAAGYGAALLPHEAHAPVPGQSITTRALNPPLWRELGIATRTHDDAGAVGHVKAALLALPG
ncbi:MAG: LysR family transcriptional regulator [Ramlibacter sp.]